MLKDNIATILLVSLVGCFFTIINSFIIDSSIDKQLSKNKQLAECVSNLSQANDSIRYQQEYIDSLLGD